MFGNIHIDIDQCKENVMTREEVAIICKAMSDSNRLRIIEMLTQGEKCGCNLLAELLVSSYKDGKWQHYSINCKRFKEYKDYITAITCCGSTSKDMNSECCCGTEIEGKVNICGH